MNKTVKLLFLGFLSWLPSTSIRYINILILGTGFGLVLNQKSK